ncbi:hypothetical protein LIER_25704 [Lithospermum erythrorhizon]|uniref:Uncharacterized protein n=1 Tax=Lithospermum erythrorhizon TaxID=34254 RepID=A0AAV3R5Q8_LITER
MEKKNKLQVVEPLGVFAIPNLAKTYRMIATRFNQKNKYVKPQVQNTRGHLMRDCFKIKGFPEWWLGLRDQKLKEKANVVQELNTPMEYRFEDQDHSRSLQNMISLIQQEVGKSLKRKVVTSGNCQNEANLTGFDHLEVASYHKLIMMIKV